jgi:hypothetical protein
MYTIGDLANGWTCERGWSAHSTDLPRGETRVGVCPHHAHRVFAGLLSKIPNVVMVALVDYDPGGLVIMNTIRNGGTAGLPEGAQHAGTETKMYG